MSSVKRPDTFSVNRGLLICQPHLQLVQPPREWFPCTLLNTHIETRLQRKWMCLSHMDDLSACAPLLPAFLPRLVLSPLQYFRSLWMWWLGIDGEERAGVVKAWGVEAGKKGLPILWAAVLNGLVLPSSQSALKVSGCFWLSHDWGHCPMATVCPGMWRQALKTSYAVLVSYVCCSKLPPTYWLKIIRIYLYICG